MKQNEEYARGFQSMLLFAVMPFTAKQVHKRIGCSLSTAYRLIGRYWEGYSVWQPKGGRNFHVWYFPPGSSIEYVQEWLKRNNKRGKSKAHIYEKNLCGANAKYSHDGKVIARWNNH